MELSRGDGGGGIQREEPPPKIPFFWPLSHIFEPVPDKFGMEPLATSKGIGACKVLCLVEGKWMEGDEG